MKKLYKPTFPKNGLTLIELTVVISIILVMLSTVLISVTAYRDWQEGIEAGETLKGVYQAQRLFLADNPTTNVGTITNADIIPYLPDSFGGVMPTVTGLDGVVYAITVNVSPPIITGYTDPSGSTDDGQWDAGK
ncbi:type II secretion system protein [Rubritalea marina]|uniref:type II secretion system protein n=1 Tax=Rubritalea marina TaxID=361055 RepID=UPI00037D22DE|nr:type II secretion system protein [Rubritalea marina]